MTADRRRAVIRGTGSSLPEKILTNEELERMVETSNDWIMSRTGIRERHVARPDEYMSMFATRAAEGALRSAGLQGSDLDLVICATVTPDSPIPATSCIVQNNLGATGAAAFDMSAGCTGFIYGLAIADSLIASGMYRNIMLIGAELLSKYVNWKDRTGRAPSFSPRGKSLRAYSRPPSGPTGTSPTSFMSRPAGPVSRRPNGPSPKAATSSA
jgi:3-oxoacyl-[acyl-carrier-protein] synthase-3